MHVRTLFLAENQPGLEGPAVQIGGAEFAHRSERPSQEGLQHVGREQVPGERRRDVTQQPGPVPAAAEGPDLQLQLAAGH